MTDRLLGPVRIVGTGLLGTSIGLALRARGVEVVLADISPSSLALAVDYGAGRRALPGDTPQLIVVAVPPDVTAQTVAKELASYPEAVVTDVASVKAGPFAELTAITADISRYLGSHPMAGRERGGAISARADLFVGRPWVIAEHSGITTGEPVVLIEQLAVELGAIPIRMSPQEHDNDVALVSHVPHVVSALLARRLVTAGDSAVSLVGQGLRDTTRIAASDPELWVQILGANAAPIADVLRSYREDVDAVIAILDDPAAPGARRALAEILAGGNAGVARIPGKHGQSAQYAQLVVIVDDTPGQLARLLSDIGAAGINMEDLRLEHSPGAQIGLVEISVLPELEQQLANELIAGGWRISEVSL